MAAIRVYQGAWNQGRYFDAGEGTLYASNLQGLEDNIGSIVVSPGYAASIYCDRGDGSDRITIIGGHPCLWRLMKNWGKGWRDAKNGVSLIKVIKDPTYNAAECVTVWWVADKYVYSKLPLGEWHGSDNWGNSYSTRKDFVFYPNDQLDSIEVPPGIKATVYRDGTDGSYAELTQGHYNLFEMGLGDQISVIKVEKIGYKRQSIRYFDAKELKKELVFSSTDTQNNRTSQPQTVNSNFSQSFTSETTVEFNVTSGITLSQSATYGSEAIGVSGETSVEVSTEISAGKSTSKSVTTEVSEQSDAVCAPYKALESIFHVYKVTGKQNFVETLVDAHGHTIEVRGQVTSAMRYDSSVSHVEKELP